MKVKCIDNNCHEIELTIGKTYEVIRIYPDGDYTIIDDIGGENWYYKNYFIPLSEYRNDTINKLLTDEN